MKIFKLEKFGRFLKTVGKQVVVGLTSISLIGLPACGTSFDAPKPVQKQKDYNYYFKVIVPEEIERSMTAEKNDEILNKIGIMKNILDNHVDRKYRNVEDSTMNPAAVASVAFVSQELRDTVDNLAADNVMVMFPYKEFLADHSEMGDIGKESDGSGRYVSRTELAKVFVYDGQDGPGEIATWKSEEIHLQAIASDLRGVEGGVSDVLGEDIAPIPVKDPVAVGKFYENLVDQIASNPAVSMDVLDSSQTDGVSRSVEEQGITTISLKTDSSEMIVELENVTESDLREMQRSIQNENERGWFKKLRKQIKSIGSFVKQKVYDVIGNTPAQRWRWLGWNALAAGVYFYGAPYGLTAKFGRTTWINWTYRW